MNLSIIIPTYNRSYLLRKTLESVESQTYTDWECIIVDDHSTDDTKNIVSEFINRDTRFKFISNERKKGAQGARNTGLLAAQGNYISFFDSDNLMHPERYAKQIRYLYENPSCDVCTCYSHLVNDDDEISGAFIWITKGNIFENLIKGGTYVDYNSTVQKRKVFDIMGLLDEDCPSYQEWDTYIRMAKDATFGTVHELLIYYYQRTQGRISNDKERDIHGLVYIYAKHKESFISIGGDNFYHNKLFLIAKRMIHENILFQRKIISIIPELKRVRFKLKLKIKIRRLWR